MKKTYVLKLEGKNRDRLLDASKNDIRKYIKRERAKALPEDVDFWDFDCKVGASEETAAPAHFAEIMAAVDVLVVGGADQFYVEIIGKPGHRTKRPVTVEGSEIASETPQVL